VCIDGRKLSFAAKLTTVAVVLLLTACSGSQPKPQPAAQAAGPAADPYTLQQMSVSGSVQQRFEAGLKLIESQDWARAKAHFEALHHDEPKLAGPLVNLARIARAQNEADQAQALLKQAITLNKYNWDAYLLLGLTLREKGDFKGAAAVYDDALALWPDNEVIHLNAGILHDLYLGNASLALNHYQHYLKLHAGEDKWVKAWVADLERRQGGAGGTQ
jgi:tetratricopeptide (TPR) repeat protein